MATRPMYASMLPSVKCSSCGDEILISMMGDHICSGAGDDEQAETQPEKPEPPRIPAPIIEEEEEPPSSPPESTPDHHSKLPPIDPSAASGPRAPSAPLTPASTISQSSTMSQPLPSRSITDPLPLPTKPPSPPPETDPPAPSLSNTALVVPEIEPLVRSQTITYTPKNDVSYAPVSPRVPSSTGLLQRMHTITPGPFHLKKPSLKKKPSIDRLRISKDAGILHISSPSIDTSGKTDHFGRPLPTGPPPPRPARPDATDEVVEGDVPTANVSTSEPSERGRQPDSQQDPNEPTRPLPQRPRSRSRSRSRSQSATRSQSQASSQPEFDTVPPLPSLSQLQSHSAGYHQHTPTDSVSSNGSRSVYDDRRTESFRSSPPTSHASGLSQRNLSMDGENDRITSGSEYSVVSPTPALLPSTTYQPRSSSLRRSEGPTNAGQPGANFSRPRPPEPLQLSASTGAVESSPSSIDSPVGPALRNGSFLTKPFIPPPRKDSSPTFRQEQWKAAQTQHPTSLPSSNRPQGIDRPTRTCRGCQKPIVGKSIKDGSRRLTGRYHKGCFVCRTCREPFPTTEFYVLKDHPYCSRHYHILNNSLCAGCNWGIEGSYLETDSHRKYHTSCFTCHDCRHPLPQDYFEINGVFYCEQDAMRVHQKMKMQTPGKRFPERRQTKLMMM